jgi:Fe-S-cluster-containing dehydrogenase component
MESINRRCFLRIAGGVAAGAAIGSTVTAVDAAENFHGNPDRFGVLVDTTLCIGQNCRRCEFACAREHALPTPAGAPEDPLVFDKARRGSATQFTVVNRYHPEGTSGTVYVKRQCMHCDEPACASACLVKAFTKTEQGAVVYDASVCIGCRYCMVACPFDVPAYEFHDPLHPRVRKCTFCFESRVKDGKAPACIEACPREVMTFGKRSELVTLAHQKIGRQPERYVDYVYGEHDVGGTSWMYLSGVPFEQIGFRTDLGTTPYPELTRNYLSAAPLIMAIWPGFFLSIYLFAKRREELNSKEVSDAKANGGKA